MISRRLRRLGVPALLLLAAGPASVLAQERGGCVVLCVPEVNVEPTVTVENLFGGPRVASVGAGITPDTTRLSREAAFEAILAVGVPTALSGVGLTLEVIWSPFADDNALELETELNILLLTGEETGGLVSAHFDVIDQFSPAERSTDGRAYTHKLNFELDVGVAPFHRLTGAGWLPHVEVELSLDYLATGLPRRGDEAPPGEHRFLDDASPWSLSFVLVLPAAPLRRE